MLFETPQESCYHENSNHVTTPYTDDPSTWCCDESSVQGSPQVDVDQHQQLGHPLQQQQQPQQQQQQPTNHYQYPSYQFNPGAYQPGHHGPRRLSPTPPHLHSSPAPSYWRPTLPPPPPMPPMMYYPRAPCYSPMCAPSCQYWPRQTPPPPPPPPPSYHNRRGRAGTNFNGRPARSGGAKAPASVAGKTKPSSSSVSPPGNGVGGSLKKDVLAAPLVQKQKDSPAVGSDSKAAAGEYRSPTRFTPMTAYVCNFPADVTADRLAQIFSSELEMCAFFDCFYRLTQLSFVQFHFRFRVCRKQQHFATNQHIVLYFTKTFVNR